MAYNITSACSGCNACKLVCPQKAIVVQEGQYMIAAHRCNECEGHYEDAQCASICPVETAIVDSQQQAVNPLGSLTGLVDSKVVSISTARE